MNEEKTEEKTEEKSNVPKILSKYMSDIGSRGGKKTSNDLRDSGKLDERIALMTERSLETRRMKSIIKAAKLKG